MPGCMDSTGTTRRDRAALGASVDVCDPSSRTRPARTPTVPASTSTASHDRPSTSERRSPESATRHRPAQSCRSATSRNRSSSAGSHGVTSPRRAAPCGISTPTAPRSAWLGGRARSPAQQGRPESIPARDVYPPLVSQRPAMDSYVVRSGRGGALRAVIGGPRRGDGTPRRTAAAAILLRMHDGEPVPCRRVQRRRRPHRPAPHDHGPTSRRRRPRPCAVGHPPQHPRRGRVRPDRRLYSVNWGETAGWLLKLIGGATALVAFAQAFASLSRASRLRRQISSTQEILSALSPNSDARPQLEALLTREVLSLCALTDPDPGAETARWRRREAYAGRVVLVLTIAAFGLARARPDLNVLAWLPIVTVPLFMFLSYAAAQQMAAGKRANAKP